MNQAAAVTPAALNLKQECGEHAHAIMRMQQFITMYNAIQTFVKAVSQSTCILPSAWTMNEWLRASHRYLQN